MVGMKEEKDLKKNLLYRYWVRGNLMGVVLKFVF